MSLRSCASGSPGSVAARRLFAAMMLAAVAGVGAVAQEGRPADEDAAAQIRALNQKLELLIKQNQLILKLVQTGGKAGAVEPVPDTEPPPGGSLGELMEQTRELKDQLDRIYAQLTLGRTNVTVVTASGTPAPVQPAPGVDYVQDDDQYVRVRVKDAHQEWEVRVDPAYADLNIVLVRSTDAVFGYDPALERRTLDELANFLKDQLKAGRKGGAEESIKPGVLEDLHRAQKLFYARKYPEALASVQRSLSVQKTALGYALEGSIQITMGNTEAAIVAWDRALEINPDMDEVRAMLALVRRPGAGSSVPVPPTPRQ